MPEMDVRPFADNLTNEDILDAIRKNTSPEYQRRIPEATKAGVQDVLQNLTKYRPLWNEFIDALVNKIGLTLYKNNTWSNPLAKFKRGMLTYGDTIEEINVGLIKARAYNSDRLKLERDVFGQYPPEVQTSFHRLNRADYYPLSINEPLLQRAFLENGGLQTFITQLMQAPTTSDNWDEFLITTSLFKEYKTAGGFFNINVPDISINGSTPEDAKFFLRRVRELAGNLGFLSTRYNASGMPMAIQPEDLELFITPEALASIDVEALAGAFNIEKAAMPGKINLIPKEHFGFDGVQAILTTREFFVIADTRIESASIWNPAALMTNYFLHHWQVISASRFVPAILFTSTEPSTPFEIEETPVTGISTLTVQDEDGDVVTAVERGQNYQVVGYATTTPEGGENDAIRLEVAGALGQHTFVTANGVLHVDPGEPAFSLIINAFAVDSEIPQITASVTVDVDGDKLVLWPEPHVESDSDSDGLLETTPEELEMVDNVVTIPSVVGVQYLKAGVNVNNGSEHTIVGTIAFTAVARAHYELTPGAPVSWSFTAV